MLIRGSKGAFFIDERPFWSRKEWWGWFQGLIHHEIALARMDRVVGEDLPKQVRERVLKAAESRASFSALSCAAHESLITVKAVGFADVSVEVCPGCVTAWLQEEDSELVALNKLVFGTVLMALSRGDKDEELHSV